MISICDIIQKLNFIALEFTAISLTPRDRRPERYYFEQLRETVSLCLQNRNFKCLVLLLNWGQTQIRSCSSFYCEEALFYRDLERFKMIVITFIGRPGFDI